MDKWLLYESICIYDTMGRQADKVLEALRPLILYILNKVDCQRIGQYLLVGRANAATYLVHFPILPLTWIHFLIKRRILLKLVCQVIYKSDPLILLTIYWYVF